jgi:hypothetical protein
MPFMKRFFKFILTCSLLFCMLISFPKLVKAGDPDPGCDPLNPGCPIDGGLTALLVIGAGYGIKKVRDSRKSEE